MYTIGNRNLLIEDPVVINDDEAVILVLPYWYKDSIVTQIKDMGLKNKICTL